MHASQEGNDMESMDHVWERFEALAQQPEQWKQQTHAIKAHTSTAERLNWWRGITCGAIVLVLLFFSALQAQPLDQRRVGSALPPVGLHPDVPADTLKTQVNGLVHSLTAEQRAQIGTVLQAHAPATQEAGAASSAAQATPEAPPSPEALQAEQERISKIIAGIRATLTVEQAALFDATLPRQPDAGLAQADLQPPSVAAGTLADCYYAYVYNLSYVYTFAYYADTNAYLLYVYYSGSDPIAANVYTLASTLYTVLASNAQYYSYYAYYVNRAAYSYAAWFYSDYAQKTAYAVFYLGSLLSNTWVPNAYAYNTQYYAYYSYYYSYYYTIPSAYSCAH
jgi:hypothetical protein